MSSGKIPCTRWPRNLLVPIPALGLTLIAIMDFDFAIRKVFIHAQIPQDDGQVVLAITFLALYIAGVLSLSWQIPNNNNGWLEEDNNEEPEEDEADEDNNEEIEEEDEEMEDEKEEEIVVVEK
ncbi:hypothetical protein Tco_1337020 [Tanacetum coccineum]